VCPWNAAPPRSDDPAWQPRSAWDRVDLLTLSEKKDEELAAAMRGSPMRRTKVQGLRRNIAVSLGFAALEGCATTETECGATTETECGAATETECGAGLQPCDAHAETTDERRR
jgi:epoxyqueuosine reductase QueG